MENKKQDGRVNNGGNRAGAGAPLKYGEETEKVNLTFRAPISKKDEFKIALRKKGNALLKTYIKKK